MNNLSLFGSQPIWSTSWTEHLKINDTQALAWHCVACSSPVHDDLCCMSLLFSLFLFPVNLLFYYLSKSHKRIFKKHYACVLVNSCKNIAYRWKRCTALVMYSYSVVHMMVWQTDRACAHTARKKSSHFSLSRGIMTGRQWHSTLSISSHLPLGTNARPHVKTC